MEITSDLVKDLREKTGCGIMDCKKALAESNCDVQKAVDYLRKKGLSQAEKRSARATDMGLVHSYIHMGGKIGVLVEINCETDFVARTDDFKNFANDVAMHIAAFSPLYVNKDQIPEDFKNKEKEIYMAQARESGKPDNIIEKMVEGKLDKQLSSLCLLHQPFVRDQNKTIQDIIHELIAKTGESIKIKRFTRFQLGDQN